MYIGIEEFISLGGLISQYIPTYSISMQKFGVQHQNFMELIAKNNTVPLNRSHISKFI